MKKNVEMLFHASKEEFDEFERYGDRLPSMGLGHYLTPSIEKARQYGDIVMAFEVKTENCLDWGNLTQEDRVKIEESLLKCVPESRIAHFGETKYEITPRNQEGLARLEALQEKTRNAYNDSAKAKIVFGKDISDHLKEHDLTKSVVIKWKEPGSISSASNSQLMAIMQEYHPELARHLGYDSARYGDELVIYSSKLAQKIGLVSEECDKKANNNLVNVRQKTIALNDYYKSDGSRELAHKAKKGDVSACLEIAKELSENVFIPKDAVFVPVPSSNGIATSNLIVCNELSKLVGIEVSDCLKGKDRLSLYDLKKNGIRPSKEYLSFETTTVPDEGSVFLFDIVVDSAATMNAAREALGDGVQVRFLSHSMVDLFKERNLEPEVLGLEK